MGKTTDTLTRKPEEIRETLAAETDELATRLQPKNVMHRTVEAGKDKAKVAAGVVKNKAIKGKEAARRQPKAVAGGAAVLGVLALALTKKIRS